MATTVTLCFLRASEERNSMRIVIQHEDIHMHVSLYTSYRSPNMGQFYPEMVEYLLAEGRSDICFKKLIGTNPPICRIALLL